MNIHIPHLYGVINSPYVHLGSLVLYVTCVKTIRFTFISICLTTPCNTYYTKSSAWNSSIKMTFKVINNVISKI